MIDGNVLMDQTKPLNIEYKDTNGSSRQIEMDPYYENTRSTEVAKAINQTNLTFATGELDKLPQAAVESSANAGEGHISNTANAEPVLPSDNDEGPREVNPSPAKPVEAPEPVAIITLSQVGEAERRYQEKYWRFEDDTDTVRCRCCAAQNHTLEECPSRQCRHCLARDEHFASACPLMTKCPKCRVRGHVQAECPSKLSRSHVDGFTCDWCGERGHVEKECAFYMAHIPSYKSERTREGIDPFSGLLSVRIEGTLGRRLPTDTLSHEEVQYQSYFLCKRS